MPLTTKVIFGYKVLNWSQKKNIVVSNQIIWKWDVHFVNVQIVLYYVIESFEFQIEHLECCLLVSKVSFRWLHWKFRQVLARQTIGFDESLVKPISGHINHSFNYCNQFCCCFTENPSHWWKFVSLEMCVVYKR